MKVTELNPTTSPLARLDPRASTLLFIAIVVAALLFVDTISGQLLIIAYVGLALVGSGFVDGAMLRRHGVRLIALASLVILVNGVFTPGETAVGAGSLRILSVEGLRGGVYFALRLVSMVLAMALLVTLTPPGRFASGVAAFVYPISADAAARMALYGFVAMSFIPIFGEEFRRLRTAQSFRGGDITGGLRDRARAARTIIVPLFISAIHRSGQLAMVVELRRLEKRLAARRPRGGLATLDIVFAAMTAFVLLIATSLPEI